MVDPVGDGDGNRESPPLSVVYKYYEDDKLEDFISAATDMLEHDPSLDRYYTIQLLLLVANSVEDDADTLCYIVDAERLYKTARASSSLQRHDVENLDKLGTLLEQVSTLIYKRPDPNDTQMEHVDGPATPCDSSSTLDGEADESVDDCAGGQGQGDKI